MKNWSKIIAVFLVLALMAQGVLPINEVVAEAAQVNLNSSSITIRTGQTYAFKLIGTTKKAIWSSSNKKIATVNSGKVKGVKTGSTTITAMVDKKKYTAKVTVVKAMSAKDFNCTGSTNLSKGFINYCDEKNYSNAYYYFNDVDGDYDFKTNRGIRIGSSKSEIVKKYGYTAIKTLNPKDDLTALYVRENNKILNGVYDSYYKTAIKYYEYSYKKGVDTYRIRFMINNNKVSLIEYTKNAGALTVSSTEPLSESNATTSDLVYVAVEYLGAVQNTKTNKLDLSTAFTAIIRAYSADVKKVRVAYTKDTADTSYDYLIYTGSSKTLTIPEKINGVKVESFTAYGESAGGSPYDGVETLILPSTVTGFCWVSENPNYGDLKKVVFNNSKDNVMIQNKAPKGIEVLFTK